MPVKWTPENDHRLLLTIIATHSLSIDYSKVADNWPDASQRPTPRAISERLAKIRKDANLTTKDSNVSKSGSSSAGTPRAVNVTPRGKATGGGSANTPKGNSGTTEVANSSGKRKRPIKKEDQLDSDDEFKPAHITAAEKRSLGLTAADFDTTPTKAGTGSSNRSSMGATPTPRSNQKRARTSTTPAPRRITNNNNGGGRPLMGPLDFADPFDVGAGEDLPDLDYGFGSTAAMEGGASIFGGDFSAASFRPAPANHGFMPMVGGDDEEKEGSGMVKMEVDDDDEDGDGFASASEGLRSEYYEDGGI